MYLSTVLFATAAIVSSTRAQQFIVPPDLAESTVPDESLSYAFGQTMSAKWWTDWQTVSLKLETCEQNTTFTLFASQPNRNGYTFVLDPSLAGACSGHSLTVVAVADADGYPAKGLVINSQHFKILNVTNPPSVVGAFTEPITTGTGSGVATSTLATTILASTGTVSQSPGIGSFMTSTTGAAGTSGSGGAATSPTAATATNGGSSTALKDGLGIGLGLGIPAALAAIVVWTFFRRRKKPGAGRQNGDELSNGARDSTAQPLSPSTQQMEVAPKELMGHDGIAKAELKDSQTAPALQEADAKPRSPTTNPSELEGTAGPERQELAARSSHHET